MKDPGPLQKARDKCQFCDNVMPSVIKLRSLGASSSIPFVKTTRRERRMRSVLAIAALSGALLAAHTTVAQAQGAARPADTSMLDDVPEFERAVAATNVVLLLTSIEEHGSYLPPRPTRHVGRKLTSSALSARPQHRHHRRAVAEHGPMAEGEDFSRSGTYIYPGSRPSASSVCRPVS